MKINDGIFNNPQKQLYENTKAIKILMQYIKEAYHTNSDVELNIASISVAKSLTNADANVTSGWLLDSVGSLFKITGGDEDSLLLDFFSSLRGPQGESGAAVNIDDTGTAVDKCWSSYKTNNEIIGLIDDSTPSATKVWSSQKTNTEVGKAKDKGIYSTLVAPTFVSDNTYTIDTAQLATNTDIPIKEKDLVIYIDFLTSKADSIYQVLYVLGTTATILKLGNIGGGKQLYQHNVGVERSTYDYEVLAIIISEKSTAYDFASLKAYFTDKGIGISNQYRATGYVWIDATNRYPVKSIYCGDNNIVITYNTGRLSNSQISNTQVSVTDQVIPI